MKFRINIFYWINNLKFRWRFGFSRQQLSLLYGKLVARDDSDWAEFKIDGNDFQIKNTHVWAMKSDYSHSCAISISGNYEDGSNNCIYEEITKGIGEHDWKTLLIADLWQHYPAGEWVWIVKALIKYYKL